MATSTLDLSAPCHNLVWTRKDSFAFDMVFVDDETDELIDFTGTDVVLTVNGKPDGTGSDLFTLTPLNAVTLDDDGLVQWMPEVDDNDMEPGTYYYDVQWTYGSSERTIVRGRWTIRADISN